MNRRRFVQGLASASAAALLGCGGRAPRIASGPQPIRPGVVPPPPARPHHIVMVLLHGGYDSLLTFDPKLPDQVSKVDLEYRPEELLKGRERLYGPLFKPLMPFEDQLAILHSVRVDSTAHEAATTYIARGRVSMHRTDEVMADRIGAALPGGAPIEHLVTGSNWLEFYFCGLRCTDRSLGARSNAALLPTAALAFAEPDRAYPDYMADLRDARRAEADELFAAPDRRAAYTANNRNAVALGELLAQGVVREGLSQSDLGKGLNAAIEAIRLNKARFITVITKPNLIDTHLDNLKLQSQLTGAALADIAAFLGLLGTTANQHGPLIDQTTVVIGTEMGRFSRLNSQHGRDHWPENAWLFAGRGIKRARNGLTIGATDDQRRSLAIDFATGQPAGDHGKPVLVQSAYATLVKAAGLDPKPFGYRHDEVLSCLLA